MTKRTNRPLKLYFIGRRAELIAALRKVAEVYDSAEMLANELERPT